MQQAYRLIDLARGRVRVAPHSADAGLSEHKQWTDMAKIVRSRSFAHSAKALASPPPLRSRGSRNEINNANRSRSNQRSPVTPLSTSSSSSSSSASASSSSLAAASSTGSAFSKSSPWSFSQSPHSLSPHLQKSNNGVTLSPLKQTDLDATQLLSVRQDQFPALAATNNTQNHELEQSQQLQLQLQQSRMQSSQPPLSQSQSQSQSQQQQQQQPPLVAPPQTASSVPEEWADAVADKGLTSSEAERRVLKYGRNELEKEHRTPVWMAFLLQFKSPLILALLASSIIALSIGEYANGVAIIVTILLNAILSVYIEHSADLALEALSRMASSKCNVRRDGNIVEMNSDALVPGTWCTSRLVILCRLIFVCWMHKTWLRTRRSSQAKAAKCIK